MARKRPGQSDSSSPNTVLVVFLVLFILATLGVGGWAYSLMDGKKKAETDVAKAADEKKAFKNQADFYKLLAYEARIAQGDPVFGGASAEFTEWQGLRDFIENDKDGKVTVKDENKFKDLGKEIEKARDDYIKSAQTASADLGWDKGRYKTTYQKKVDELRKQLDKIGTLLAQREKQFAALSQEYASLDKKYNDQRAALLATITTGNKEAIEAATKHSASVTSIIETSNKQKADLDELQKKLSTEVGKRDQLIKALEDKLASAGTDKGGKGAPPPPAAGSQHALLLDISKGKTLWDRPVAKVTRIDERDRTVTLDKGEADGVKARLSFNVFGAGWDGKAEGAYKGTVEVIRVSPRSSVARITSLYDREGNEVLLNDPSPNRLVREGTNALKEGDLLFNLAWGAHVAVAGVIDFSGLSPTSASAQQGELDQFLRVLAEQGVKVDGYIDLRDGKVSGAIGPKTQYLIRGYSAYAADPKSAEERLKTINAAIDTMRKQASDRGLFVISPDNFMNVTGYRRTRSKLDLEVTGFRPAMPGAAGGTTVAAKDEAPVTDLTGRWSGKLSGGGTLRLTFKGDGGCVWQMVVGADTVSGFTNVQRSGQDYTLTIQNRPATVRGTSAGTALQVTGQNVEAMLTRE